MAVLFLGPRLLPHFLRREILETRSGKLFYAASPPQKSANLRAQASTSQPEAMELLSRRPEDLILVHLWISYSIYMIFHM